jgi:lipopolysaccharide/colanic/teichoic acid biosynthesis glycosyltransferase
VARRQSTEESPEVRPAQARWSVVASRAIDQSAPWIDAEPSPSGAARSTWRVDATCRALDIVGSALLLTLAAPLLLILAIAVRLDSPGPALFRQRRLGRNLQPFVVNKFRTMHDGTAHDHHREFVVGLIHGETPRQGSSGPRYKMTSDLRVTRIGRALRRSSLDELPQLWNVLRGEMSLVGPRPPIEYEVEHYPARWFARFAVKPGMTGLWQVNGRSEVALEEMVRLDIEYTRRRSLRLNLALLVRTLPAVLSGRGAS